MKNKFLIICIVATGVLIFHACDYVRNANPPPAASSTGGTTGSTTGSTTASGVVYRKVLIEDYTGHKCGNCPAAARELRKLDSLYAGKVIPMAVHAGFYANVTPGSSPPYPTDLRSVPGTDYDNTFGNGAAGNPNGLVNRVGYGTSNFVQQWSNWGSSASGLDTLKADFKIDMGTAYNSVSNQVTTTVTVTALAYKASGQYNLVVLLTEDSIIGEQIDYSLSGNQYVSNYTFNHVLRAAVNSAWGDTLFANGTNINDIKTKAYPNFQLSSSWKHQHCHIIVFVYDANTASAIHYEIMQVEMKDIN